VIGDLVSVLRLVVDLILKGIVKKDRKHSPCFRLYRLWLSLSTMLRTSESLLGEVKRFLNSKGYPDNIPRGLKQLAKDLSVVQKELVFVQFLKIYDSATFWEMQQLVDHKGYKAMGMGSGNFKVCL